MRCKFFNFVGGEACPGFFHQGQIVETFSPPPKRSCLLGITYKRGEGGRISYYNQKETSFRVCPLSTLCELFSSGAETYYFDISREGKCTLSLILFIRGICPLYPTAGYASVCGNVP